ncbi:MAG: ABC transporter permease [Planctomycetota bacterium]|nr:ABC transporter permease [Planctomycetota bacterium]
MPSTALFIAACDLKYLLRQRETLLWTFLMPALFFYFIGTVTGGGAMAPAGPSKPDPLTLELPYEPREDDVLVAELARRLETESFAVTITGTAAESGRRLVLPPLPAGTASWSAALAAGTKLTPVYHQARRGNSAELDLLRVGKACYGLLLDLVVIELEGGTLEAASFADIAARPRSLTVESESAGARPIPPSGYAQTIPGTMVMFTMVILLTGGSILIVTERREGLLRRLASAPVTRGSVLLGKWLGRMGLAVIQLGFSMVLGALLFGMDWGPQLPMVCVLLLFWAAFNASLALLLANLVRTEGQMAGIAVISSMVLAALGGCWWPIEIVPGWMQSLASMIPTGWTMEAMHSLVHYGHGPASVLPNLALLGSGALALGALAARTFRFE